MVDLIFIAYVLYTFANNMLWYFSKSLYEAVNNIDFSKKENSLFLFPSFFIKSLCTRTYDRVKVLATDRDFGVSI